MKIQIFWDVVSSRLVVNWRFGEAYCLSWNVHSYLPICTKQFLTRTGSLLSCSHETCSCPYFDTNKKTHKLQPDFLNYILVIILSTFTPSKLSLQAFRPKCVCISLPVTRHRIVLVLTIPLISEAKFQSSSSSFWHYV